MPTFRLMSCRAEVVRSYGAPVAFPLILVAYTWWATGLQPPALWAYPMAGVLAVVLTLVAVGGRPDRPSFWVSPPTLGRRSTSLSAIWSTIQSRLPGRRDPIALWAFVSWQMFVRYTLPG